MLVLNKQMNTLYIRARFLMLREMLQIRKKGCSTEISGISIKIIVFNIYLIHALINLQAYICMGQYTYIHFLAPPAKKA